jgi:hypothetical protein
LILENAVVISKEQTPEPLVSTREAAEDSFDPGFEGAHIVESEVSEEVWLWLQAIEQTEVSDCRLDE